MDDTQDKTGTDENAALRANHDELLSAVYMAILTAAARTTETTMEGDIGTNHNPLRSQLRELAQSGMTMIIVTHETGFATEAADRILMFDEGVIIEDAPPDEFFNNPQQERTQAFLSQTLT